MYLGIDLGTSEVKVLLLASDGSVDRHRRHAVHRFASASALGRTESRTTGGTARAPRSPRCARSHPDEFAQVRGIGLSGQMHGAVLLDAQDRVLRPAILWNDMRSDKECAELTERAPELHRIAGNLAMPGFTAPKLLWVAHHEPDIFAQTACVLLPKDYLRLQLTGGKVSDPSDAAGTLWLDVASRDWSDALLAACDMTRAQMPALAEGSEPSGTLLPELARELGLRDGVIVAAGGGDNATSAIGIGATQPGDGFVSLGTSGVLCVVGDRFRPNPASAVHAFCHAIPDRWHQMSVMLSAASCLRWVCKLTSTDEPTLLAEIEALPARSDRRPHRSSCRICRGERTPHNDPYAQGVFFGMTHATDRALLGYAVLEGVTLALTDGLDALRAAGTEAHALSLLGGGARSDVLGTIARRRARHDHPHARRRRDRRGARRGAARLAGRGRRSGDGARQAARRRTSSRRTRERHAELLRQRLKGYRELYRHVRPLFDPARPRLA